MIRAAAGAAAALVLLTACAAASEGGPASARASSAAPAAAPARAEFTDSGVTVSVRLDSWDGSAGSVTAVLTPQKPGFHLYSVDLPADGVDGVGRPTVVRVAGALSAQARPHTDAPVHLLTIAGTGTAVPVYPDGPVTVSLPVRGAGQGRATVLLGYAACSETEGCLFPVADHPVEFTVDGAGAAPAR